MTKGTLQFVPKGWRVVPEEATEEQIYEMDKIDFEALMMDLYKAAIKVAPQLTTPPVLRWDGDALVCGSFLMADILFINNKWRYCITTQNAIRGKFCSKQEARRAAEKALGIPFEVEEK